MERKTKFIFYKKFVDKKSERPATKWAKSEFTIWNKSIKPKLWYIYYLMLKMPELYKNGLTEA